MRARLVRGLTALAVLATAAACSSSDRAPECPPCLPASEPRAVAHPPPVVAPATGPDPGIVAASDGGYRVSKDVLVELALAALGGQISAAPLDAGGFRLLAVAPGSLLAQLGLQTDDEVTALNRVILRDASTLALAHALARETRKVTLEGRRRGAPLLIEYALSSVSRPGGRVPPRGSDEPPVGSAPAPAFSSPWPAPSRSSLPTPSARPSDPRAELVRTVGPNRYEVPRRVVASLLDDPAGAATLARGVPALEGGVKLYGIRTGSLLVALGFKNGDTLRAIDGVPVDPASWRVALGRVRNGGKIVVEIERRGERIVLEYTVL